LPKEGELYISTQGNKVVVADINYQHNSQLIIRKVKRWRVPVLPADWGKLCRYRDNKIVEWYEGATLRGWDGGRGDPWLVGTGIAYRYCEVEE
jgi:hypothetical protein